MSEMHIVHTMDYYDGPINFIAKEEGKQQRYWILAACDDMYLIMPVSYKRSRDIVENRITMRQAMKFAGSYFEIPVTSFEINDMKEITQERVLELWGGDFYYPGGSMCIAKSIAVHSALERRLDANRTSCIYGINYAPNKLTKRARRRAWAKHLRQRRKTALWAKGWEK